MGFFQSGGYNSVGKLSSVDFGMDARYTHEAQASAYLVNEKVLPELLPPLKRSRHKYQAGYVIALAGSPGMPGASDAFMPCSSENGCGDCASFSS